MGIQNIFKELGLKQEHAQLYIAGLEWGETSITNLSERAKVPRTSAYLLIEGMLDLGIFKRSLKRGRKNYIPCEPSFLKSIFERRKLKIQQTIDKFDSDIIGQLTTLQNLRGNKPKLHYMEGADGIKQAYEMTFSAEELWIQCLTEDYKDVVSEKWFDNYFDRFFSSDIRSKEILRETEQESEYMKKYRSNKNLQLRVKTSYLTETDFMLYENTCIFVSFDKENPYALIIEDGQISSCMRNLFELAWKQASVEDRRVKSGEKVKTEF